MNLLIFFRNIFQLVLSPANGWKDISSEDTPVEVLMSKGLYPMMALMLVSVFLRPIYGVLRLDLVLLLQIALVQFVALFVSLFAGRSVMENYLPQYNSTGEHDPFAAGTVAVYVTGLMTLIQIFENLLPVDLTVMQFLPAFAAVILWKSDKYLDISPNHEMTFMLIAIVALIMPVILINLVMSYLIN